MQSVCEWGWQVFVMFFSSKCNPRAFREAYLRQISTKFCDLSCYRAPRDGSHCFFTPHDQENADQCIKFNLVLICSVTGLSTLSCFGLLFTFFLGMFVLQAIHCNLCWYLQYDFEDIKKLVNRSVWHAWH